MPSYTFPQTLTFMGIDMRLWVSYQRERTTCTQHKHTKTRSKCTSISLTVWNCCHSTSRRIIVWIDAVRTFLSLSLSHPSRFHIPDLCSYTSHAHINWRANKLLPILWQMILFDISVGGSFLSRFTFFYADVNCESHTYFMYTMATFGVHKHISSNVIIIIAYNDKVRLKWERGWDDNEKQIARERRTRRKKIETNEIWHDPMKCNREIKTKKTWNKINEETGRKGRNPTKPNV